MWKILIWPWLTLSLIRRRPFDAFPHVGLGLALDIYLGIFLYWSSFYLCSF